MRGCDHFLWGCCHLAGAGKLWLARSPVAPLHRWPTGEQKWLQRESVPTSSLCLWESRQESVRKPQQKWKGEGLRCVRVGGIGDLKESCQGKTGRKKDKRQTGNVAAGGGYSDPDAEVGKHFISTKHKYASAASRETVWVMGKQGERWAEIEAEGEIKWIFESLHWWGLCWDRTHIGGYCVSADQTERPLGVVSFITSLPLPCKCLPRHQRQIFLNQPGFQVQFLPVRLLPKVCR